MEKIEPTVRRKKIRLVVIQSGGRKTPIPFHDIWGFMPKTLYHYSPDKKNIFLINSG
jgi:hypothetical protein